MEPTPAPPQPSTDRRLYRAPQRERSVGGVARGIADYLGVSAGWIRFAFIVTTLFGGLGIVAYLIGWLVIPERPVGMPPTRGDHNIRFDSAPAVFGAVLILIAVSILFSEFSFWSAEVFWATVLIVAGVALFQRADASQAAPGGRSSPTTSPPAGMPAGTDPAAAFTAPPAPPPPPVAGPGYRGPGGTEPSQPRPWTPSSPTHPPKPRRERSALGRITMAATLVVVGALIWLDQVDAWNLTAVQIGAAGLATIGAGLVVGAIFGRARWLMVIAALLAAPLVVAASLDLPLQPTTGQRTAAPTSAAELPEAYRLGVGQLHIDLTGVDFDGRTVELETSVGLGELRVTVPDDVGLDVTGSAGAGELQVLDVRADGPGVERRVTRPAAAGEGTLVLEARAGVGSIDIETAPADAEAGQETNA